MTVSSTTRSAIYAGNGATTAFAVPFYFLASADLRVVLKSAGGVETVQTLISHYTVAGAGNPAGGTVTMVAAPATGTTLAILRAVAVLQQTDFTPTDPLPAETLETALDRLTMIGQQIDEKTDRALTLPATAIGVATEVGAPVANNLLGWNSTGTALQSLTPNSLGVLTTNAAINVNMFSGTGAQVNFVLSADPLTENNTWVHVAGVYIQKNAYSLVGTTLTFAVAPANGTNNIEVVFGAANTVAVGTPSDGSVTPAKLSAGGPSWDASGNLSTSGTGNITPAGGVYEKRVLAIASAGTVNLSAITGNSVHITGATTITAITLLDGQRVTVIFDGILTLTNGAGLVLPGAANLTTGANMVSVFLGGAGSVTRMVSYSRQASALITAGLTMATARLIGRTTAGIGATEEITVGAGLTLAAGALTASAVGGMTTITSGSLTGTAVSITDIPATYSYLVLQITGASFTALSALVVRADTDNGASYNANAADYPGRQHLDTATNFTTASLIEGAPIAAASSANATLNIFNYHAGPLSAACHGLFDLSGGIQITTCMHRKGAAAINALQISGGTFDAGTYALYGVS